MNLSKETVQKLETIKACILAEPELYDQGEYPSRFKESTCETPCCIAGWAAWVNNPNIEAFNTRLEDERYFGSNALMRDLGITCMQAQLLFADWPEEGFSAAWKKPGTKAAALAGAKRIDLFIASDGTV